MVRQWRWGAAVLLGMVALPAMAAMKTQPVEWQLDGTTFSGVLVYDDGDSDKRPGLVMVPNWKGVNDSAIAKAKQLAGDDYVVLVADVYGKGVRPKTDAEAGPVATKLRNERPVLRARALKAIDVLKAQAGKAPLDASRIGAVGFCFGGTTVLEMARAGAPLAGVVSLHGGLGSPLPAKAGGTHPSVLVLNGADDKGVSKDDIASFEQEMNAAKVDWEFTNYSGAVHCFAEADANSPPGCLYNERAAKRAWKALDEFFEERFETRRR
ncbi:dienelactone hydrolase family protein [Stenotrophomonas sp. 364]|jgi:dienelactone hydrolase|uniref:dienelactone hydrolase family protein n=1 Tax=Stenotrophomonas sp. 364 TaxID=2691571 RepID=UPI001317719E|nr:dienelactone hydrolase family protein [Stenotrophomonas sp. 364]QHB70481.1 dienelactone hydrolase family protein [Stenotrophomonas sp. 364]